MDAAEWVATAICVALLLLTAWSYDRYTKGRNR